MMNKSEQLISRPILVWENAQADGGEEATVQELHTGGDAATDMPVIRIVSSGFGTPQAGGHAVSAAGGIRCAA